MWHTFGSIFIQSSNEGKGFLLYANLSNSENVTQKNSIILGFNIFANLLFSIFYYFHKEHNIPWYEGLDLENFVVRIPVVPDCIFHTINYGNIGSSELIDKKYIFEEGDWVKEGSTILRVRKRSYRGSIFG